MCGRARSPGVVVGALLGGALVISVLVGLGAGPAWAEPTPTPTPTPSVSPPSQEQIDDAKAALDRLRNRGKTPTAQLSQVAGPTAEDAPETKRGGVSSPISDEAWWTIGAGLLVLLVASETTRLRVRRAKHRKGA